MRYGASRFQLSIFSGSGHNGAAASADRFDLPVALLGSLSIPSCRTLVA